jgi:hypothetical protein
MAVTLSPISVSPLYTQPQLHGIYHNSEIAHLQQISICPQEEYPDAMLSAYSSHISTLACHTRDEHCHLGTNHLHMF